MAKQAWFVKTRGSYLPANWIGLLLYLAYIVYIVLLLIGWYADGHRVWYFLTDVIPFTVGAALVAQYVASKHAK
jgi:hypothetical protein